ncbi:MAG: hypothetical protein A2284_01755 [Deltaproteobacteria bacterium RIFOXYA12_FULL_61_11]|nr:MAG: hypothetical protein A2284_01755 [Deltaproteobacteria bacterium RIFOXYA12_FULL_61_11]
MQDRLTRLADVLVHYSLAVSPGQLVRIKAPAIALPLVERVYRAVLTSGGHPYYTAEQEQLREALLRHGSEKQIAYVSELERREVGCIDAMITIGAPENTKFLSTVAPERLALERSSRQEQFKTMLARMASGEVAWVGTVYPVPALAQDAELSLEEFAAFYDQACFLDCPDPVEAWQSLSRRQAAMIERLTPVKHLHLKAPGTDLQLEVTGRRWINCDGKRNFPDGEVFTGPLETSAEGVISFSFPACYLGKEVEGVRLTFKDGKVREATATKHQDYLERMLALDEGASRIGELAFGTNERVTRFCRNILFDEKIGGTMHLALGASLPESGGLNHSALHWDMVCDLRRGGEVWADGTLLVRDGTFLLS